jgi:hypothetical protein
MNRIISLVIMRKVYLISRSHHADSVNITLDVKGFTRRYGGKIHAETGTAIPVRSEGVIMVWR